MAVEDDEVVASSGRSPVGGAGAADAFAAAIAGAGRSAAPDTAAEAGNYFREQTRLATEQIRLAKLQSQNLIEQNSFELSHLRWRRFNDQMRGALQVIIVLVGAAIVVAIGAAVWSAAHDDGLVIESFSVPPDMAARGLSGEVVAGQLLDKLAQMQAATGSNRPGKSYANNWGNDIKVQIPDTGVSAGEAYRYLSQWLGHQTRIAGEVFRTTNGIAVTIRVAGDGGASFNGAENDLDALEQKAAEQVYARTQPYRYAIYEVDKVHLAEARTIFHRLVAEGPVTERAWAEIGLGTLEENEAGGDEHAALRYYRAAVGDASDLTVANSDLADSEHTVGHDEASLAATREVLSLNVRGMYLNPFCAAVRIPRDRGVIAAAFGDYREAAERYAEAARLAGCPINSDSARMSLPVALALQHDGVAARARESTTAPSSNTNRVNKIEYSQAKMVAELWIDFALADWSGLMKTETAYAKLLPGLGGNGLMSYETLGVSMGALARANTGEVSSAESAISATPRDCYFCVRARAQIAGLGKHWSESARWFVDATNLAPSLPFAWSEWGEMLLANHDYNGAIGKFAIAHQKGPHFADPLELWGEALMQENRSDLALAKFEEANKYAPKWGRLHLEWGKALWWSGDKTAAKQQFAIASGLDLSATDRESITNVSRWH